MKQDRIRRESESKVRPRPRIRVWKNQDQDKLSPSQGGSKDEKFSSN
jgi:hypothetical protein